MTTSKDERLTKVGITRSNVFPILIELDQVNMYTVNQSNNYI